MTPTAFHSLLHWFMFPAYFLFPDRVVDFIGVHQTHTGSQNTVNMEAFVQRNNGGILTAESARMGYAALLPHTLLYIISV